jgi:PAS domain S-box-containing protein
LETVRVQERSARTDHLVLDERIEALVRVAGGIGIVVGSVGLVGWLFNVATLKGNVPWLAPAQANVAVAVALAGISLLGFSFTATRPRFALINLGSAGLVVVIGLWTLAEQVLSVDLGIDRLLVGSAGGAVGSRSPGRMPLMTAVCASCLGSALLLLDATPRLWRGISQALALTTIVFALLDLMGYAHGVYLFDLVSAGQTMPPHAALTLLVLGVGTLAARPELGLMRRFMADDAGGWLLRNLLPLAIFVPLALGGVRATGEAAGLYPPRFGSSVLVLAEIVTLPGLLLWAAGSLSRLDGEKRRAERAMREQEGWLRTTVPSIGDAVVATALREARSRLESTLEAGEVGTWEFDPVNNVVRADRNLARLFGITPEDAAGGPLEAYMKTIHPDDRDRVVAAIGRALENGDRFEAEYRLVGSDRAVHWIVARWRVERNISGRAVRMPGVVVDITGRKQAEERERRLFAEATAANAKFRAFFEQGALFAGIMDLDGTIIEPNRLSWEGCGYTKEQIVDKPFWEGPWWAPSVVLVDRIKAASAQAAAGQTFRAEMPYFVADGSERLVDLMILPIKDETDRIMFLAPTGTDITERRRMENDLRTLAADLSEADRRKDEFLATLAHELRNPLAPIRNALQIMRMARDDRRAVDESRTLVERQVAHMVRLIDDLMDISRITRGKLELRKERVELATVIRHAVETSRPLVEGNGHRLSLTLSTRPIFLDADVTRLAQVFSNLMNNAARYTDPGGDIVLVAESQGSDVVVTVRDNGVGIPPEMLPHVFDIFTQVNRSLGRSQGGLGIGLTLVRTLVQMHGGSVAARSAGHGLGSEFVVRLPVVVESRAQPMTLGGDTLRSVPAAGRRILVVDDNHDAARTLAQVLKLLGHEARTVHDGGAAVDAAEQYRPELMLLDIGLPVMNGYDVAKEIRKRAWGRDIVIVALTGWGQEGDRRRSQEAGIDNHLVKPVDLATLETLLADLRTDTATPKSGSAMALTP